MSEPIVFINPRDVDINSKYVKVGMDPDDDSYDFSEYTDHYDVKITITEKGKPFEPGYYRYIGKVDVADDPGLERRTVTWFDSEPTVPEYVEGMENWEPVEVTRK